MSARPRAVVLLSGGLDSATAAAIARSDGFDLFALTIAYGQRHRVEIEAARAVARALGAARHVELQVDLSAFGGSALTDRIDGAEGSRPGGGRHPLHLRAGAEHDLPVAGAGWAEAVGAQDIYIGVNALDYSGYPDCRPGVHRRVRAPGRRWPRRPASKGATLRIHAPLMHLTKAEIIRRGLALGVDYAPDAQLLRSRTRPGTPCGHCDSCRLRAKGFAEAGVADPWSLGAGRA